MGGGRAGIPEVEGGCQKYIYYELVRDDS